MSETTHNPHNDRDYSGVPVLPVADNDTLAERRDAAFQRHLATMARIGKAIKAETERRQIGRFKMPSRALTVARRR
jgi:hypothetical protein